MRKENLRIVTGKPDDFGILRRLYDDVIEGLAGKKYDAGWKKGLYPTDDMIKELLSCGELFPAYHGEQIAGAMVINHRTNEGYVGTEWGIEATPKEVAVIHMLCVHPDFSGRHIADALVEEAERRAECMGAKAIRLDVLKGNRPAEVLYERHDFKQRRVVNLYYDDTGWTDYILYEKILSSCCGNITKDLR